MASTTANVRVMLTSAINRMVSHVGNIQVKIETDFREKAEEFLKNLDDIARQEILNYGREVKQVVLNRFDQTSRYAKPKRKTGRLRLALNREKLERFESPTRGVIYVYSIGDQSLLPAYWRAQEYGSKSFAFDQMFLPVTVKSRRASGADNMYYGGQVGKRGSLKYVKLISMKKEWFLSRPKVKPFVVHVSNPGIARRGFISMGRTFMARTIDDLPRRIVRRGLS